MKASFNYRFFLLLTAVVVIVVAAIVSFFALIRNEMIGLTTERMMLVSEKCTNDVSKWAEKILGELEVYRDVLIKEGANMDEHTRGMLSTTLGKHSEYPYGIYWCDKNNNIYVTSGLYNDDLAPTERIWYTEGLAHTRFEFGEPYVDEFTGNPCVSATARIITNGVEGMMAADVYLDYASGIVSSITTDEIESAFIVTKKSRLIVADSDSSANLQSLEEAGSPLYRGINSLLDRHFLGSTQLSVGSDRYYININRIESTDWLFVTCMNRSVLNSKLLGPELIMAFIGVGGALALILLTFFASRKMKNAESKAKTDPLTGIFNRDGFKSLVGGCLDANALEGVLLLIDMDNFKRINDNLGHPEGDEVLKSFAALLGEYFNRARDYNARIGGDEFAVFIGRHLSRESLERMLDKFMERFHERNDEKYSKYGLSISLGAAFAENSRGSFAELYKSADDALYRAKQNGKNNFALESRSDEETDIN